MTVLRLTMASWPSLGARISTGLPIGKEITPLYIKIEPTLKNGVIRDQINITHNLSKIYLTVENLPFSYDLVDPIGTTPDGWGYLVEISSSKNVKAQALLTTEILETFTVIKGFRIIELSSLLDEASPI